MLIYDALKKDHEKVKSLINELLTFGDGDAPRCHQLISEIRDELIPHARAEESVFYNSLRSLESAKTLVAHSFKEHFEAETLLRTLQVKDRLGADWRPTLLKFKEALEHHIAEEEEHIFPAAQQLFTDDEAEAMGEVFEELKPKIKDEGFVKTTFDLIANAMPPRFTDSFRSFGEI